MMKFKNSVVSIGDGKGKTEIGVVMSSNLIQQLGKTNMAIAALGAGMKVAVAA